MMFSGSLLALNLLQADDELIASLNLSIMHWSVSKNKAQGQIRMFRIESCAKQPEQT